MTGHSLCRWVVTLSLAAFSISATADAERSVETVRFPKGESATIISGRIKGYNYIDYQLRASAGQTIKLSMKGSNGANYFNLLPPGTGSTAMAIGEFNDNAFEGLLPDDGIYTVRVYLMRSAARRKESSDFKLSVAIDGLPLKPVSATVDAVIPGTPFHARTTAPCEPAYTSARQCEVLVIRRGYDGTATVELRWQTESKQMAKRRILFIKGSPVAADVPQPMTFSRDEHGWKVIFTNDEHFDVPAPLVFGG